MILKDLKMSMLTTEEIINLYLWGDKVAPTPEAIADDKYIRDKDDYELNNRAPINE